MDQVVPLNTLRTANLINCVPQPFGTVNRIPYRYRPVQLAGFRTVNRIPYRYRPVPLAGFRTATVPHC